ncbi:unnamed protein product [Agarophyton chilense]|eukprot:gb/GEZJ01002468.1/.p1 GENE.gb/GEZJ01002468.1/~~gb/GEZJ01002468.1/.p1  ORF type:complete len:543 (-),score=100.18 gb/GEZJ01002468.1/:447-2075(-)
MSSEEYRSIFNLFDKDKSGFISPHELRKAIRALGQKIGDQDIDNAVQANGLNVDEISYEQFVEFMQALETKTLSYEDVSQIFRSLDVDCSGYLTAAEVRHFMTGLNLCEDDAVVDEMISLYDLDGNGQITIDEFLFCLKTMGYHIDDKVGDFLNERSSKVNSISKPAVVTDQEVPDDSKMYKVSDFPKDLQQVMSLFDFGAEHQLSENNLKRAAELLRIEKLSGVEDPETNPALHWTPGRKKNGLGGLVYKANHLALIVSDVGRSTAFYTNVMGFQQIRRPNFDRHGAWFTIGNLELHLIKGTPVVHTGDDLIVGHISIETYNIEKVPTILRQLNVPFRQNVSVPSGADADAPGITSVNNSKIVRQYFIRDPDGYYIEICNCDVLTSFCLGEKEMLEGYEEGVKPLSAENAARAITLIHKWAGSSQESQDERESFIEKAKATDGSIASYAKLLGYTSALAVTEEKLRNLLARRAVYGDICQNESEENLKQILIACGNDVPKADRLMKLRVDVEGSRIVHAPVFFEDGTSLVRPKGKQLCDDL